MESIKPLNCACCHKERTADSQQDFLPPKVICVECGKTMSLSAIQLFDVTLIEGYADIVSTLAGKVFMEQMTTCFKSLVDTATNKDVSPEQSLWSCWNAAKISLDYLYELKAKKS